jgi:tRNA pseudouridine55 synthase
MVTIHSLSLTEATRDEAVFVMECGTGAYVRALARDLGRLLECFGHVTALRRTRVGPFVEDDSFTLDEIENQNMAGEALLSVEAGLAELPCVIVDRDTAARLRRGGSVILRGRDAPHEGVVYAACGGVPVAFGEIVEGALAPHRVFNLPF